MHGRSDTAFKQQRMVATQPVVTPAWVVGLFMTVGVLFVPLGTWLKLRYAEVVEVVQRYEGSGKTIDDCSISEANEGKEVTALMCSVLVLCCYQISRRGHGRIFVFRFCRCPEPPSRRREALLPLPLSARIISRRKDAIVSTFSPGRG